MTLTNAFSKAAALAMTAAVIAPGFAFAEVGYGGGGGSGSGSGSGSGGGNGPIVGSFGGSFGGQVLGISTTSNSVGQGNTTQFGANCSQYLTSFIRPGARNDAEQVKRLQYVLGTLEHLTVGTAGVYDAQTIAATKAFQLRYANRILAPWGLTQPTGNVFLTTRRVVNEIYCNGKPFPLTAEEQAQIDRYTALRRVTPRVTTPRVTIPTPTPTQPTTATQETTGTGSDTGANTDSSTGTNTGSDDQAGAAGGSTGGFWGWVGGIFHR